MTLYQALHDAVHARSGQEETLKLQFIRTEKECVMGWVRVLFVYYSRNLAENAFLHADNSAI